MKLILVCPKCMSRLKVGADKVPAVGGWARCPKCSERFFVKAPGSKVDLHSDASRSSAAPAPRRVLRDSASQLLLNKLKSAKGVQAETGQGLDNRALIYGEVTIFPDPAPSPAVCQGLGIALLALPLLFLTIAFINSSPPSRPSQKAADFRSEMNDEGDIKLVRSDLVKIRRGILNQTKVASAIDRSGSESRVFKYYSSRLVPGICDAISRLELESERPTKGFEMTAVCAEGRSRRLKMEVTWNDKIARVKFPAHSKHEDMDLFPALTRTASPARVNN